MSKYKEWSLTELVYERVYYEYYAAKRGNLRSETSWMRYWELCDEIKLRMHTLKDKIGE